MLVQNRFPTYLGGVGSSYIKPNLIKTGSSSGTFTVQPYGWDVTMASWGGANTHYYMDKSLLDPALTAPVYWEITNAQAAENVLYGMMQNPTTAQSYLGYNSVNWGYYNYGSFWLQSAYGGSWSGPNFTPISVSVIGFWWDLPNKKFRMYAEQSSNSLQLLGEITLTSLPGVLVPGFTNQGTGPTQQIRVGPGQTIFTPPGGATYY